MSSKTQWLSRLYYADFISFYSPTQLCGGGTMKSNSYELPISVPLSLNQIRLQSNNHLLTTSILIDFFLPDCFQFIVNNDWTIYLFHFLNSFVNRFNLIYFTLNSSQKFFKRKMEGDNFLFFMIKKCYKIIILFRNSQKNIISKTILCNR